MPSLGQKMETMEVKNKQGHVCVINAADYDPAIHVLPGQEPAKAEGGEGDDEKAPAKGRAKK